MRGLVKLGEYLLEIVIVIALSVVSLLSVILYIPLFVGLTGFFSRKKSERLFKDIFKTIKENIKIIFPYTIFQLLFIIFPVLNIYFFNTHPEAINKIMLALNYIALVIGGMYIVSAPTIIVNMNVTFTQLLRNGIMLLFGSPLRSLVALAIVVGVGASVIYFPYIVILLLYIAPLAITIIMRDNFLILKAKALKTSVYEIKKQEKDENDLQEGE